MFFVSYILSNQKSMGCDRCESYIKQGGWERCIKCGAELSTVSDNTSSNKETIISNYSKQCAGNFSHLNSLKSDESLYISRWDSSPSCSVLVFTKSELESSFPILKHFSNWEANIKCAGKPCGLNKNIRHLIGDRKTSPNSQLPVLTFFNGTKTVTTTNIQLTDLPAIGKVRRERLPELFAECIGLEIADDARPVVTSDTVKALKKQQEAEKAEGRT